MFRKTLFLLAVAITLVAAAGNTARGAAPSVLGETDTPFGTLTVYGRPKDPTAHAHTSRQFCGSPGVECSSDGVPDAKACMLLASAIEANPDLRLPSNASSVCVDAGGACCTSWGGGSDEGVRVGSLLEGVLGVFGECIDPAGSGRYLPADLDGVCTFQCLASVPNACEVA